MKGKVFGAASSVTLAALSGAGGAFVVNILSARMLGPDLRGSVALILQLSYFVSPLLLLGADRRIIRAGRSAHTRDALPMSVILLATAAATPFCFLIGGFGGLLAIPISLVGTMFAYGRSWNVARGTPVLYVFPFVLYQVTIVFGSLALFFLGVDSWVAWTIVYVLPGVFVAAWQVRHLAWWGARPFSRLKIALRENGNYMAAALGQIVTTRLERVLLPVMTSPRELGLYIVVATASEPLFWFAQALSDVRVGAGKRSAFAKKSILVDLAFFSLAALLGGLSTFYLIGPIFGAEFAEAKNLILPLMVSGVLLAVYRQMAGRLLLGSRRRHFARAEVLSAIGAAILYPSLIMVFDSAAGAAWGSVAVYALASVILAIFIMMDSKGAADGEPLVRESNPCSPSTTASSSPKLGPNGVTGKAN